MGWYRSSSFNEARDIADDPSAIHEAPQVAGDELVFQFSPGDVPHFYHGGGVVKALRKARLRGEPMSLVDIQCHAADTLDQEARPMASLNISLPEPLRDWIEARVKGGRYGNASEYLRELIRRDQERQAQERLEGLLLEGVKSGATSPLTKRDWTELRANVAERLERCRGGRANKLR
jgi:antitoxin ParD1/3/4